jgi:cell wall-active antibiotic response 4TMS protein YvqF
MLGPLLLIVIGVLFLLNNMYPGVFRFGKMWPVILIVIGLSKVFEYFQGHAEKTDGKKEGQ